MYIQKIINLFLRLKQSFWNIILIELDHNGNRIIEEKIPSPSSRTKEEMKPILSGPSKEKANEAFKIIKSGKREKDDRRLPSYHESQKIPNLRIVSTPEGNKLPQFNIFGETELPKFDTTRYLYAHFSENPRDLKQTYPITTNKDGVPFEVDYFAFASELLAHFPGIFIGKPKNAKAEAVSLDLFQKIMMSHTDHVASVHVELPQYTKKYIDLMYNQSDQRIEQTFLPDTGEWFRMMGSQERQLWRNLEDLFEWREAYTSLLIKVFKLDPSISNIMFSARQLGLRIFPYERLSDLQGNPDAGQVVKRISTGTYVSPEDYWREKHLQGNHFKRQQIAYNNYLLREAGVEKTKYLVYGEGLQGFSGKVQNWDAPGLGVRLEIPSLFFIASDEVETHGIYKAGYNCYFLVIPDKIEEEQVVQQALLTDQTDAPIALPNAANDIPQQEVAAVNTEMTPREKRRAAARAASQKKTTQETSATQSQVPENETPLEKRRRLRRERREAAAAAAAEKQQAVGGEG